jgi:hypothetical protein
MRWCAVSDPKDDLLYDAWTVIANVSEGRWSEQSDKWVTAALRWRDRWHAHLDATPLVDGNHE